MARVFSIAFVLLVAVAGLIFHVRNRQEVDVDFVISKLTIELSWVVVATLVVGAVCGIVAMASSLLRARAECRRLNRQSEKFQRELTVLRSAALKDGG